MKHKLVYITGHWNTHDVFVDGEKLNLAKSLQVRRHSPSGFNWGYGGSGPAQLALAILLELLPEDKAVSLYQYFKQEFIANLPQCKDFVLLLDIDEWAENREVMPICHKSV